MAEIITCPECQRRLRVPDEYRGKLVLCPRCKTQFPADNAFPDDPPTEGIATAPVPTASPPPARRGDWEPERPRPRPHRRPSRGADRVRKPQGSGVGVALAILGGVAAVGVLAFAGLMAVLPRPNADVPPAPVVLHDPGRGQLKPVPDNRKPVNPVEIEMELKPLFVALGNAFRAGDRDEIGARFDPERVAEELTAFPGLPLRTTREKRDAVQELRRGLADALLPMAKTLQWTKAEIRDARRLGDFEVVAVVRHTHPDGSVRGRRWWLTRQHGEYKVYDLEWVDRGQRFSTMLASLVEEKNGKLTEVGQGMVTLREAADAVILREDADNADRKLREVARVGLPPVGEALRFLVTAEVRLRQSRFQEALDGVEQARAFQPDMPVLDLLKGTVLNKLGHWDEALKLLEAYRDLLGEDGTVCQQIGVSLRGLQRFPEAAVAHRKALDFQPKNGTAFLGLLRSLAEVDDPDDLERRFSKLDNFRANFDVFADDCEHRQLTDLLEPLAPVMHKIDPEYAPAAYYLSLFRVREGQAAEAVSLFKDALAHEPEARKKEHYTQGFLKAMAAARRFADAYRAVPDARPAFRFLAAEAKKTYHTEELRQLVTAHGRKHADDPLLPWYQAELYVRDGRYALAEKTFAAALANRPDEATLKDFRASRVEARYYTGEALSAHRDVGPREETFVQLAGLCLQDDTDAGLQALLDQHARTDPESIDLLRFRSRLRIRQDRLAEGVALFKAVLARRLSDQKRKEVVADFLNDALEAGKALDGYRAAPEAAHAFRFLAGELRAEERDDELRKLIEAHRAAQPADPWLALYQAELHLDAKAWARAAELLREGMKKADPEVRPRLHWKYVYAMYRADRGMEAYAEAGARGETFTQLVNLLAADKKGADLEALIRAHRPHAGDEDMDYYEARARALRKQPAEAAALFQKAYGKLGEDDGRRWQYRSGFLQDMEGVGLMLEGYRAVPDKAHAFSILAGRLLSQKKDKDLAALLEEHGKAHAADVDYQCYAGELRLLRGDPAGAAEAFAAALAKSTPANDWRARYGLARARVKAGKAVETYREMAARPGTFEQLANLCVQEKDAKQLQGLIDARRQAGPEDATLAAWDLEVCWLNQDHEGALKLLTEHREDVFDLPRFRWKAQDYRVRGLVKLMRTKEAVQEATTAARTRYGNRVLLVLAHAATGDVKQTIAVLEKGRSRPYLLRSCYQDPDLGPLLRGEPFRELREKFPQPKERERVADWDEDD
jgi:predicted Zn-dependent protease